MRSWSLSEELYRSFHQWPRISLFFLIGCLAGWLIAWVLPPNYRASANVYVALNPYRTYEDSNFLANVNPEYTNLDDYKNWQMAQLNSAVYLDEIIQETLDRLKEQDQSWQAVEASQLRDLLKAEWRTAGKWSLVADNRKAELATQAAETWGDVIFKRVGSAVDSARDLMSTDNEMGLTAQSLAQASSHLQQLETIRDQLKQWEAAAKALPADEPLAADERWEVLSMVAGLAKFEPSWMEILKNQPDETASRQMTLTWIDQVLSLIESEIPGLNESIKEFEQKQTVLKEQYAAQFDLSLGLSPNLEFEKIEVAPAERVQPTGLMTLIGGVCGLLLWVFKELVRINNQLKTNEQAKPDLAAE
jgi:hypothetical protein